MQADAEGSVLASTRNDVRCVWESASEKKSVAKQAVRDTVMHSQAVKEAHDAQIAERRAKLRAQMEADDVRFGRLVDGRSGHE